MHGERKIDLLKKLGRYIVSDHSTWRQVKEKAAYENPWFVPAFIDYQLQHIASEYLAEEKLESWASGYSHDGLREPVTSSFSAPTVGIVMAGNIPLAGFHDFLAAFVAGRKMAIKPSSKDAVLIHAIVNILKDWEPSFAQYVTIAQQLKGCDAYIATGSNNSSRYFDYYFSRYPHIIRRNRTSVAILSGHETPDDLKNLADDVHIYFGLGCRNVTKIFVPRDFDFVPLLEAFKTYDWVFDHNKYKNNYDYQLAIMIINKMYYMTNGSLLLVENPSLFSPISQLNYEFYDDVEPVKTAISNNTDIQCVVGKGYVPFGQAQKPAVTDYADRADTLRFLLDIAEPAKFA